MKGVTTLALAIALLATSLLVEKQEVSAHSGEWYVTKWNGTYLRTCPSTSCGKIALIPNGDVVEANRHRGNWAGVWYGDSFGWVSLNVIRQLEAPYIGPSTSAPETCFANSWGQVVCAEQWVTDNVWAAANAYGVSYWTMMALAACESNFDYGLVEWSGAIGLFQWMPSTWAWIGSGDIWSVSDQSYSTARAIANGYASHWECWYRI